MDSQIKLGIAVVYLVRLEMLPLLELHLNYIERMTSSPWELHGVILRSPDVVHKRLKKHPNVIIHEFAYPGELLNFEEHSWYLDQLLQEASKSNCTHFATLHLDSFPIQYGWENVLATMLTKQTPIVGVLERVGGSSLARICPSGLLMSGKFYREHQPRFFLPMEQRDEPRLKEFMAHYQQKTFHSGVTYAWKLHELGLEWHPLKRSNIHNVHPILAGIYGGLFFHLGATSRVRILNGSIQQKTLQGDSTKQIQNPVIRILHHCFSLLERHIMAPKLFSIIRKWMPLAVLIYLDRSAVSNRKHGCITGELLKDPQGFLKQLQEKRPNLIVSAFQKLIPLQPKERD